QIGPDLGLVLAKGVAISLLTVFLFSPVLILQCSTLMDRLHHRSFMPSFERFGRFVTRAMLPAAAVFAVLIVPCYRAQGSNDYYYGSGKIFGPETRLGADTQEVEDVFGQSDTYVLMVPKGNTAREQELSTAIRAVDKVSDVLSFVDNAGASIPMEFLDEKTRSLLISENYSRMVISVAADPEGEETFALIQQLRDIAQSYYPDEWLMAGEGVSTLDLKETVTSDMTLVNLLAIGAVFVVLLLSFRSLSLPVILVLAIENAIWINLSIPYFRGQTIFYLSYLIISSIQLGATVDYAILFTDRYLENRRTMARREAIIETVSAVTVSVLTSGLTLTVVGFLLGYISTHGLLSQLGMFLGVGTICSMLIVLLALPGLLYLLDDLIRRTTRGAVFYGEGKGAVRKASRKTARKAARDSRLDSGNPFDMPPEQAAVPWDTPVAAFDSGNPFDMPPAQAAAPWGAPAAALDSDNPFAAPPAQAAAPWSAPAAALDSDNPFATPPAQESAPRPAPAAPSASGNPFDMPPAQEPAPRPAPAAPSAGGNPFDMPPAQEAAPRPAPAAPSAGGNPFDMPPAQEPAPRPAPAAPSASGNPFDMPPAQEPAPRPAPAAPSASGNPFDMPPAQEPAPRPAYDVNRNNPFYIP
ncbi:MAG: MMPL family transporter, partial [Aristaeellaceae bacterium]